MVGGNLCGSVVASTNTTCTGGSSNVFNSALKAPLDNIWVSSITYTLNLPMLGAKLSLSIRSRMLSTPVLEAASISIRSNIWPRSKATHIAHLPHGSPSTPFLSVLTLPSVALAKEGPFSKQLIARAKIRAIEVLPVPLGPENK